MIELKTHRSGIKIAKENKPPTRRKKLFITMNRVKNIFKTKNLHAEKQKPKSKTETFDNNLILR